MYRYIAKIVQLGSNNDQCYIQNRVVANHLIKKSRCICILLVICEAMQIRVRLTWQEAEKAVVSTEKF